MALLFFFLSTILKARGASTRVEGRDRPLSVRGLSVRVCGKAWHVWRTTTTNVVMNCKIKSNHIHALCCHISRAVMLCCAVLSRLVSSRLFCLVPSCLFLSRLALSLPFLALPCLAFPYLAVPCLVLSCLVMSWCLVCKYLQSHSLSFFPALFVSFSRPLTRPHFLQVDIFQVDMQASEERRMKNIFGFLDFFVNATLKKRKRKNKKKIFPLIFPLPPSFFVLSLSFFQHLIFVCLPSPPPIPAYVPHFGVSCA
jgi:hypothetical protein